MNRLNLNPRTISKDEQNQRSNLRSKARYIRQAYKDMEETKKLLQDRQERQQSNGKLTSEVEITDSLIEEKLQQYKSRIRQLEKEYRDMNTDKFQLQKEAQKQQSLNF